MKLLRRQFLHLAASGLALPTLSRIACAQAYPSRPVRLIVGFPAGGTADIVARLIGQWLSEHLGQPFIIENRPGAASNIGAEIVVRSPPDGYTLLMVTATNATNATLYEKLNFNFIRDITPVARVAAIPSVVEVNPAVPANTLPEFIAYAKANPGRINFASTGNGSLPPPARPSKAAIRRQESCWRRLPRAMPRTSSAQSPRRGAPSTGRGARSSPLSASRCC